MSVTVLSDTPLVIEELAFRDSDKTIDFSSIFSGSTRLLPLRGVRLEVGVSSTAGTRKFVLEHLISDVVVASMFLNVALDLTADGLAVANFDKGIETFVAGSGAAVASVVLTMAVNPTDGDTITIDGKTYTFQDTLTNVDGNVKIGALVTDTQNNLEGAITLASGTPGTDYATAMTAHPSCTIGNFVTNDATVSYLVPGVRGNSVAVAETFTSGSNLFSGGATSLAGGIDGSAQHHLPDILLSQNSKIRVYDRAAIDAAADSMLLVLRT